MDFLKEQNIHIYSIHSDLKAVFVERFKRTLLDLIKEPMYIEGKACWLNHLDTAMEKYNTRVHTTTRMTPFEAINQPIDPATFVSKPKQPKVQVGDYVRVLINAIYIVKVIQQIGIENFLKYIKLFQLTQLRMV